MNYWAKILIATAIMLIFNNSGRACAEDPPHSIPAEIARLAIDLAGPTALITEDDRFCTFFSLLRFADTELSDAVAEYAKTDRTRYREVFSIEIGGAAQGNQNDALSDVTVMQLWKLRFWVQGLHSLAESPVPSYLEFSAESVGKLKTEQGRIEKELLGLYQTTVFSGRSGADILHYTVESSQLNAQSNLRILFLMTDEERRKFVKWMNEDRPESRFVNSIRRTILREFSKVTLSQ